MSGYETSKPVRRRLPKAQRRVQLLATARKIVREEGADRLTLGHLAERAGLSKPVIYDHFETRSVLLIELYRWIDMEVVDAFRDAMAREPKGPGETVETLSAAYIKCASETNGEFQAVGAALAGSQEKTTVFKELLENCVQMFVTVLKPHSQLSVDDLSRCCVGLVGAGQALAGILRSKECSEAEAIATFSSIIRATLCERSRL